MTITITEQDMINHTNCSCPNCVPEKIRQLPEDAEIDLPDITGYMVIPPEVYQEYLKLKQLDENVKKFSEDELIMIRTMLGIYHTGLNTGLIRSTSDDSRKAYQELILKILESLDK